MKREQISIMIREEFKKYDYKEVASFNNNRIALETLEIFEKLENEANHITNKLLTTLCGIEANLETIYTDIKDFDRVNKTTLEESNEQMKSIDGMMEDLAMSHRDNFKAIHEHIEKVRKECFFHTAEVFYASHDKPTEQQWREFKTSIDFLGTLAFMLKKHVKKSMLDSMNYFASFFMHIKTHIEKIINFVENSMSLDKNSNIKKHNKYISSSKKLIKEIEKLGYEVDRTKGSHYILKNQSGDVTVVPMHGKDLGKGLSLAIQKQAKEGGV